MPEQLYKIRINDTDIVGEALPFQFALLFVKAIYGEYYAEPNLKVSIERYTKETTEQNNATEIETIEN